MNKNYKKNSFINYGEYVLMDGDAKSVQNTKNKTENYSHLNKYQLQTKSKFINNSDSCSNYCLPIINF